MFILLENAEKDIIMSYMAEKTYSVSEAAKFLGISTGTLYSRIRVNKIGTFTDGRHCLTESDMDLLKHSRINALSLASDDVKDRLKFYVYQYLESCPAGYYCDYKGLMGYLIKQGLLITRTQFNEFLRGLTDIFVDTIDFNGREIIGLAHWHKFVTNEPDTKTWNIMSGFYKKINWSKKCSSL